MTGRDVPCLSPPADWMAEAACVEVDPELWFPETGGSSREAKRICARCSVQAECLGYALALDERYGVWGGQTERARRKRTDRPKPPPAARDVRVQRVRALVAAGRSNAEIAAVLGCSDQTVGRICRSAGITSDRRPGRTRVGAS